MAAGSQLVIDALEVLVDGKHVVALARQVLDRSFVLKLLCRAGLVFLGVVFLIVANFHILVDDVVGVELSVGHLLVEVGHLLESHLLDKVAHDALFYLDLLVLETAFQEFLGVQAVLDLGFL